MKTLSRRLASVVLGFSFFLLAGQCARAEIIVSSASSFGNITIDPSSGSVSYSGWQNSAFAQAGANAQYNSLSASATDTPVAGGSSTGSGTASTLSGSSSATGFIPGSTAGFDTSTGRGSASDAFEITGASGTVSVTFSTVISGELTLSSDAYGVFGSGETDFALSVNGTVVLFSDLIMTIGPNQSRSGGYSSETLTGTMMLTPGVTYSLWAESDAEAMVVNSNVAAVPEPAEGSLLAGCVALSVLMISLLRARFAFKLVKPRWLMLLGGAMVGLAVPARATYIGSDKPDICKTCGAQPTRQQAGAISTSLTEGNSQDNYQVVNIQSAYGPTLPFSLTYNSYNADGSRAQLDTGLGFGWTHTYNALLFSQRGQMFRLGADGRVTQYYENYSGGGGTYASDTGYFETLTRQPDGTFIVTNKYKSWWQFGMVPGSSLLVGGQVYQLLRMGDRNNNRTTLTYNGSGLLANVADTYGRTLTFTYNGSHLTSVTDPLGRKTTFTYDSLYRMPTTITDPLGNTIQYTYNSQYQITRKIDRDGRMYFYTYKSLRPFMVTDGNGQPYLSMSNPTNWSVNQTNVTYSLQRQYSPSTTSSTDGRGNTWQYSYDTNGYITQTTAPDGSTTRYSYDPATLNISSLTDANGNTTSYQYDANGNRISTTDALGDVTTWTYDPIFNEPTSMTDPLGRVTQWAYDANGNQISTTDPLLQTETWTYDAHGNVLTHTDKRGNTTTNTYNSDGECISAADPLGNTTQWTYDAVGNVLSTTDPLGNRTQWTYDALDRKIGKTNALDGVTTWTYDSTGHVLQTTDPNGNTTTWQYDDRCRVTEWIDALGGTTQWTYDANNNRITTTTPNGNVTTNAYDTQNRKIETSDPLGGRTHWTYDPQGNYLSSTDQDGNVTRWTYDPLNRVIGMTNALGGVTLDYYSMVGSPACCSATPGSSLLTEQVDPDGNITYYHYDELNRRVQVVRKNSDTANVVNPTDAATTTAYDPNNNVIAVTDPNTNTITAAYDADNRRISVVDADGNTTLTSYDKDGNVLVVTSPDLNQATYAYDPLNRILTVSDEIGLVDSYTYDPNGNVLNVTDGLGHTTIYTYDQLDRQTTRTDPLGHTTTTAYDADGNTISTTDRNGNTTTYHYDALDRRTQVIDALNHTTTTTYDPDGNNIALTDANGHVTQYSYDGLNRPIATIYDDSPPNTVTYVYDPAGNLIQRTDQKGQVTTYSYNALYYLTNRAYSPSGTKDSFIYDNGGRLLSGTRNGWTDTFRYDGANQLTNCTQNGRTLTYAYNIPGRVQTNTQPSGRTLIYSYDARERLAALTDTSANPAIASYVYDDVNRVVSRTYGNGTTASYTYNADNWITSLNHSNNVPTLLAGFSYGYDNEGNRLYEQRLDHPVSSSAYAYDALYRLTNYDVGTFSGAVIPSPTLAKGWSLDPVGNWYNLVSNGVPDVRTYGTANELLTDNTSTYLYDANGNLTHDNNYNYTYDEENRLTQVQRLSDLAIVGQYSYDALNRRVMTVTNAAGSPSTNLYFYDSARIVEEQNPGGSTLANYTYGNYIDEALTMDQAGQTYYFHQDAIFSPLAVTDAGANVAERYNYDAYGQATVLDGSYSPLLPNAWGTPHSAIGNPWLFTGRQLNEETGLYDYRARSYDAVKGRFLQRDPVRVPQANLYMYGEDDPVDSVDPSGRDKQTPLAGGGATVKDFEFDTSVGRFRGLITYLLPGQETNYSTSYSRTTSIGIGAALKTQVTAGVEGEVGAPVLAKAKAKLEVAVGAEVSANATKTDTKETKFESNLANPSNCKKKCFYLWEVTLKMTVVTYDYKNSKYEVGTKPPKPDPSYELFVGPLDYTLVPLTKTVVGSFVTGLEITSISINETDVCPRTEKEVPKPNVGKAEAPPPASK
jgi:RHS repeat-associated protein